MYQAVDNIYDVLGQEIFAGIISRNHNDIENIILLIDPRAEHYFAICISKKTQKEEKNKNIQLHQALSSGETVRVAPAILTILYRVRCNMFHGTKRFGPIQVVLLAPLIRILRDIVIALKEKYRA